MGISDTSTGSTSVVQRDQMVRADVQLDGLADDGQAVVRILVADRRPGIQRGASGLDGAHDGARGVVAADALQAVGHLALPFPVDDHDQVEHPGGRERRVRRVLLAQHLPQRRLDRLGRRVAGRPGVLGHSRRQRCPGTSSPSASAGPVEPDS